MIFELLHRKQTPNPVKGDSQSCPLPKDVKKSCVRDIVEAERKAMLLRHVTLFTGHKENPTRSVSEFFYLYESTRTINSVLSFHQLLGEGMCEARQQVKGNGLKDIRESSKIITRMLTERVEMSSQSRAEQTKLQERNS